MKKRHSLIVALMVMLTGILLFGCTETQPEDQQNENTSVENDTEQPPSAGESENGTALDDVLSRPTATMTIADYGVIEIELYPDTAPNTVNNFVALASSGFYDNLTFHRVISGFMIQGGDPEGSGIGGPGYAIAGEFSQNGFENNLKHTPGVLSMARTNDPNSAGSQFFIMHRAATSLDGAYAAFGQVTNGMEIINEIAQVETGIGDRPTTPVVIENITIELNGYEPSDPVKVE